MPTQRKMKRKAEKRRCMDDIRTKSTWGKSKLHASADIMDMVHRVSDSKGIKSTTARVVIEAIFGNERTGEIGILPAMLHEGRTVDCTPFGVFGHRDNPCKITNDISQPGTMTYTPANSTIIFKPNRNTTYWTHYAMSMEANMPTEPLPPNMHFSQRVMSMPFYKDWEKRVIASDEVKSKK